MDLDAFKALKDVGDARRAEFVQGLRPPRFLRVIDCKASVAEQAVVLIDWPDVRSVGDVETGGGYTAISHTYGMAVYEAFDCACAAKCYTEVRRADPAKMPCKGHDDDHDKDVNLQQRVIVGDIFKMCQRVFEAGAQYVWHDGVCIAQHDKEEVRHFIRHMGWIYASAKETVIFLHYIGRPIAPIGPGSTSVDLARSRWQTRVWTFQEAALSKRRRYCVRVGESLAGCHSMEEFESKLAMWYAADDSSIAIIDEIDFCMLVLEMRHFVEDLWRRKEMDLLEGSEYRTSATRDTTFFKAAAWDSCLSTWTKMLASTCVSFPTIMQALENCSSRHSKHEGDRINSILALACVQDFDAPKDENLEESTIEFFKRMGKNGLALAVFTCNKFAPPSKYTRTFYHTWVPSLSGHLSMMFPGSFQGEPTFGTDNIEFEVLEDGNIELKGLLACVAVEFTEEEGGGGGETETLGTDTIGFEVLELGGNLELQELLAREAVQLSKAEKDLSPASDQSAHLISKEEGGVGGGSLESRRCFPWADSEHDRLNMNLCMSTDFGWFEASLAGVIPRVKLGAASLPRSWPSSSPAATGTVESLWLPMQERELNFSAFLIFSAHVFNLEHFPNSDPEPLEGPLDFPAILVQGTIDSTVAKVGCFLGSKVLHDILLQQHVHNISFRTNLVIR